jgi:hypothetical protein
MSDSERSYLKLVRYYLPLILKKNTLIKALTLKFHFMLELQTISSHLANVVLGRLNREVAWDKPEKLKSVTQFIANATSNSHLVACLLSENDLIAKALFELLDSNHSLKGFCSKSRFTYQIIPKADHTFTSYQSRMKMFDATFIFIRQMLDAMEGGNFD